MSSQPLNTVHKNTVYQQSQRDGGPRNQTCDICPLDSSDAEYKIITSVLFKGTKGRSENMVEEREILRVTLKIEK